MEDFVNPVDNAIAAGMLREMIGHIAQHLTPPAGLAGG